MEIFRSWRHGYFEIHIQNNYTTSQEYSKYPWPHFKNIQNTNVTMNIQNSKYLCHIFKITSFEYSKYTSLQEYSKLPMNIQNASLVIWVFWKMVFWIRRRSDYIIGFVTPVIGPNKSRKLTRLIAPAHTTRCKVWMKNNIHASQTITVCL